MHYVKTLLLITLSLTVNFHSAIYASQDVSESLDDVKSSHKALKFLTADEFYKNGLRIVKKDEGLTLDLNDLPFELTQRILSLVSFKNTHKVCKAFYLMTTGYKNVGVKGFDFLPDFKVPVNAHRINLNFTYKSQQHVDRVPSKAIYTLSKSMTVLYPAMLKKLQHTNIEKIRIDDSFMTYPSTKVSEETWNDIKKALTETLLLKRLEASPNGYHDSSRSNVNNLLKLLRQLKNNRSLQVLHFETLSYKSHFHGDIVSLLKSMGRLNTLTQCQIAYNRIGDDYAELINNLLNNNLVDINLSCNCLSDKTLDKIGDNLIFNTSLTKLNLTRNSFSSSAIQKFFGRLNNNKTLKTLIFDNDSFEKLTYASIADYIKQNHSLADLSIRVESCSIANKKIIKEALKSNKKIKVKYKYSNELSLLYDVF